MMGDNTKGYGIRIKCMGRGCLPGRMAGVMTENIIWIKKKGLGFFIGRMEESIEEIGKMGSSMEKALILIKKKYLKWEFG